MERRSRASGLEPEANGQCNDSGALQSHHDASTEHGRRGPAQSMSHAAV